MLNGIDLWNEIKQNSIKLKGGCIKILPQDIQRYDGYCRLSELKTKEVIRDIKK